MSITITVHKVNEILILSLPFLICNFINIFTNWWTVPLEIGAIVREMILCMGYSSELTRVAIHL